MYNKQVLSEALANLQKRKARLTQPKDIIVDPMGQYNHPGEITRIPGGDITMASVPYPVMAYPNVGQPQMMLPEQDYNFPGADYVDEVPLAKYGGLVTGLRNTSGNLLMNKKGKRLMAQSGSLSATNELFLGNPLLTKRKKAVYVPGAAFQDGGSSGNEKGIEAELDETEINDLVAQGYIVEEYNNGGTMEDPPPKIPYKSFAEGSAEAFNQLLGFHESKGRFNPGDVYDSYSGLEGFARGTEGDDYRYKNLNRSQKSIPYDLYGFQEFLNKTGRELGYDKDVLTSPLRDSRVGPYSEDNIPKRDYYEEPEKPKPLQSFTGDKEYFVNLLKLEEEDRNRLEVIRRVNNNRVEESLNNEYQDGGLLGDPPPKKLFNFDPIPEYVGMPDNRIPSDRLGTKPNVNIPIQRPVSNNKQNTQEVNPTIAPLQDEIQDLEAMIKVGKEKGKQNTNLYKENEKKLKAKKAQLKSRTAEFKVDTDSLLQPKIGYPGAGIGSTLADIYSAITGDKDVDRRAWDENVAGLMLPGIGATRQAFTQATKQAGKNLFSGNIIPGVAGSSVGNLATAYGAAYAPYNMYQGAKNISQGNYLEGASEIGLAGLDLMIPGTGKLMTQGANQAGKYLTQGPLKNAYKLNPKALKENPEVIMYRTQKPGQTEELMELKKLQQKRDTEGISSLSTKEKIDLSKLESRPGFGQGFDTEVDRIGYYGNPNIRNTRGYQETPEVLRVKVPREQAAGYNISNFPDYRKISTSPRTEHLLPNELIQSAEKFSFDDYARLMQEDKAFNTPHWLRGYGSTTPKQLPGSGVASSVDDAGRGLVQKSNQLPAPPNQIFIDNVSEIDNISNINIQKRGPKPKTNIYKKTETVSENGFDIKTRYRGNKDIPADITVTGKSGYWQLKPNKTAGKNTWYLSANMDNPLESGKAMLKIDDKFPFPKPAILEPNNLSLDSYNNLLKLGKKKDWTSTFENYIPLNYSSKNSKLLKDLNIENTPNTSIFKTSKEAKEVVNRVNKFLSEKGITQQARIFHNKSLNTFGVEIPNFKLQRAYSTGGIIATGAAASSNEYKQGGIVLDLSEDEIKKYQEAGYVVEEYQDGGDVKSSHGWDYKKEGDKYFTKKAGTENWLQPKGAALEAIKNKVYKETTKETAPKELPNKSKELKSNNLFNFDETPQYIGDQIQFNTQVSESTQPANVFSKNKIITEKPNAFLNYKEPVQTPSTYRPWENIEYKQSSSATKDIPKVEKDIFGKPISAEKALDFEQYKEKQKVTPIDDGKLIMSENDFIITDEHKKKFNDTYLDRARQCSSNPDDSSKGCLARVNTYYDKYIAPLTGSPSSWDLKESLNIPSGTSHTRFDDYGESADSWHLAGLLKEAGSKVEWAASSDNSKEYEKVIDKDPDKRKKFWLDLDLPLGSYVFMGDQGLAGNYGNGKSYNVNQGLVPSNHSAIVAGYDDQGVPLLYDFNGLISVNDAFWTTSNKNVTSIITPKGINEKRFNELKKEKEETSKSFKPLKIKLPHPDRVSYDEQETGAFVYSLEARKKEIAPLLNISSEEYDELAKTAVAIALAETGGGDDTTIRWKYGIPIPSYTTDKLGFGSSKGITQLNDDVVNNIFDQNEKKLKSLGLVKDEYDPWNPNHQAVLTLFLLKSNDKVIEKQLEKNPGNNKNLPQSSLRYYQYNSPKSLATGEAQGDNLNVKRFDNYYKSLGKIEYKTGGSIELELTDEEIQYYKQLGYNVEEL